MDYSLLLQQILCLTCLPLSQELRDREQLEVVDDALMSEVGCLIDNLLVEGASS